MDVLLDDIQSIVKSYMCDCEIQYISHKKQLKCCHLNKQQLASIEIDPMVVFRHCCATNDPNFMVRISDEFIANHFAEGIRACFRRPFKQDMMEWIMNRLSTLPNVTLIQLDFRDLVLPWDIGDQTGYIWLQERGYRPCEEWQVAMLADDVEWCQSLSPAIPEMLSFGIRHTSVRCLLFFIDHWITSSVIKSMFETCVDFNRLDIVTNRIQFDVWYLFDEPMKLTMSYVRWVRDHFPRPDFNPHPAINALWDMQFYLALQLVKEFALDIMQFVFTIDTDYLQEMYELFPHYFQRDVEHYYAGDSEILHFGLAHGGYLTKPIMDHGDMDESSLPDAVVMRYIQSYLELDIHIDWCVKHLLRLYPEPNMIFNDVMYSLMDDPERLSEIYLRLDWGSIDRSALIPLISADIVHLFHDRVPQLLRYAIVHNIEFGILLKYLLSHKIPFELTPLEIFVSNMDATHEQMIRLCFPNTEIACPEPTNTDAWVYSTLAYKRQKTH